LVSVGKKVGNSDGLLLGATVMVGCGVIVGIRDGHELGKNDGATEGVPVGRGVMVGLPVLGTDVGISEADGCGVVVGICVGTFEVEGIGVNVGSIELVNDGAKLGPVDMEGMCD
jgi:hypothetical protein